MENETTFLFYKKKLALCLCMANGNDYSLGILHA